MSLPRKIMEQCRLCLAKLWSNADFAPRDYGAMQTVARKITDTEFQEPTEHPQLYIKLKRILKNYFSKSLIFQRSLKLF